MKILGTYPQGPNTAACVVVDGTCMAFAEEERFIRQKKAVDVVPVRSSAYCLKEAGLTLDDIDVLGIGWNNELYRDRMADFFRTEMAHPDKDEYSELFESISLATKHPSYFDKKLVISYFRSGLGDILPPRAYCTHHLSHAYSVFYPSPFERALILVIDGSGENVATSFWIGEGERISLLKSIPVPHSLGFFYAAMTEYLGFSGFSDEGKVMGLAPYGQADPDIRMRLDKVIRESGDGYEVDPGFLYYGPRSQSFRHTNRLSELLGMPPRKRDSELTAWHRNLAWEVQHKLECLVERLLRWAIVETGIRDVCISGGVAMNCKMNGALSKLDEVDRLFVLPASSDAGCAYGSALVLEHQRGGSHLREKAQAFTPYLGPGFSDAQIAEAFEEAKLKPSRLCENDEELCEIVADRLAVGRIVGWFQGRMEVGERALGNRSILAHPGMAEMKDKLNREVKRREAFRPFAPSILAERANEIFLPRETEAYEPYHAWMLKAALVSPAVAEKIPAVVHVDGSIRPQVVSSRSNPLYHRMISAFWRRTGMPAILNTSFNVRGEPIVCTPLDALRCFYSTGLDVLAIGRYIVEKQ